MPNPQPSESHLLLASLQRASVAFQVNGGPEAEGEQQRLIGELQAALGHERAALWICNSFSQILVMLYRQVGLDPETATAELEGDVFRWVSGMESGPDDE